MPEKQTQAVFTVDEAAAHLRVSRSLIFKLIRERKLRPAKIGSRTLLTATELDRFMRSAQSAA